MKKKIPLIIGLYVVSGFFVPNSNNKQHSRNIDNAVLQPKNVENKPALTFENVKNYMQQIDIYFHDIVFKQSRIESGNFKSRICIENNNLFGMRLAKKRETTAVGENKKYAVYDDWRHSIDDYKLWQEYHNIDENTTRDEYLSLLGRIYATDSTYIQKLQ